MKIDEEGVYTTKEIAEILRVSLPTIKRLLRDGKLPSTRIGRQHRFLGKDIIEIFVARKDLRREKSGADDIVIPLPAGVVIQPSPSLSPELSSVEQRQRSYMLGKQLAKDLLDDDGNPLFQKGTIVTDDVVLRAKKEKKTMELFANLQHESEKSP